MLSPRMLNEFRAQWAPFAFLNMAAGRPIWTDVGDFAPERFEQLTPVYVFPSATWGSNSTKVQLEQWWDFRDDLSLTVGNHAAKMGIASVRDPGNEDLTGNGLGTWTFATDQLFEPTNPASVAALTNPIQFSASLPPVEQPYNSKWFQAYVQDDWRLSARLTLNLGLRYDLQYDSFNQRMDLARFPKPIPYIDPASRGDLNNLQPRIGMAGIQGPTAAPWSAARMACTTVSMDRGLQRRTSESDPDQHHRAESVLSGPVRRQGPAHVRVHGSAQHHDRRQ